MFESITLRNLSEEERKQYYYFFSLKNEFASEWSNIWKLIKASKSYFSQTKPKDEITLRGASNTNIYKRKTAKNEFIYWEHEEFGEIKELKQIYKQIISLFNSILKAIQQKDINSYHKIEKHLIFIKGFLQHARKSTLTLLKNVGGKSFQVEEAIPHQSPTGEIVYKDQSYFNLLQKSIVKHCNDYLKIIEISWEIIKRIESKLPSIKK